MTETPTKANKSTQRLIIVLLVLVLLALCVLVARSFLHSEEAQPEASDPPKLGYAEGTTVVRDSDALQAAVDAMAEKISEGNVVLEYDAQLKSADGQTFTCYLANAAENNYDMYFDLYIDDAMTDEVYLSGLVPPGQALGEITLTKKLDAGEHKAYLAFTTVEDDHETLHSQVVVAVTLRVS